MQRATAIEDLLTPTARLHELVILLGRQRAFAGVEAQVISATTPELGRCPLLHDAVHNGTHVWYADVQAAANAAQTDDLESLAPGTLLALLAETAISAAQSGEWADVTGLSLYFLWKPFKCALLLPPKGVRW